MLDPIGLGDVHHVGMKNEFKLGVLKGAWGGSASLDDENDTDAQSALTFDGMEHELNYNYGENQWAGGHLKFSTLTPHVSG